MPQVAPAYQEAPAYGTTSESDSQFQEQSKDQGSKNTKIALLGVAILLVTVGAVVAICWCAGCLGGELFAGEIAKMNDACPPMTELTGPNGRNVNVSKDCEEAATNLVKKMQDNKDQYEKGSEEQIKKWGEANMMAVAVLHPSMRAALSGENPALGLLMGSMGQGPQPGPHGGHGGFEGMGQGPQPSGHGGFEGMNGFSGMNVSFP